MGGEDVAKIRAETDALKKALEEAGGSMYQQGPEMGGGPGNAGAGNQGDGGGPGAEKGYEHVKKKGGKGSGEEDVVEGEYEKVDK